MVFDVSFAVQAFPQILSSAPVTIWLSVVSVLLGAVLGLALSLLVIYRVPALSQASRVFISYVRGTPMVVMVYIIYSVIPLLIRAIAGSGSPLNDMPPEVYAVSAFSINISAYLAEMFRSAIESVPKGQMEAALSVGMTGYQSMRRVVLPQAMLVAVPNFGNIFLGLVKGTSLAFTVSVMETMGKAKLVAAHGLRYTEVYVDAALIYWGMGVCFELLFHLLEKKLDYRR